MNTMPLTRTLATLILTGLPIGAYAQSAAPVDVTPNTSTPSAPAPPRAPGGRSWRGFYVNGFVGAAHGNSDLATSTVFSTTGYFPSSSVQPIITAGAQTLTTNTTEFGGGAGYNLHISRVVVGAEGDYSIMNLSGTVTSGNTYPCCSPASFAIVQTVDTNWLATARVRGGWTAGPALIYGTFGMAWTDFNYQSVFTDTLAAAHENGGNDHRQSSSIWGAGAELRVAGSVSIRGDYMNAGFTPASVTSTNLTAGTPSVAFPSNVFTHSSTLKLQLFRFGVSVGF